MPKKSNKTRADGRIQGRVYLGTVDGKKQYKYVYGKTQKEVNQKVAELKVKLGKGVDITLNNSLSRWCELWLDYVEDSLTYERYRTQKQRLAPFIAELGNYDINTINTPDIDRIIKKIEKHNPRTGKPTAKKTLIEYRAVISRVYEYAIQNRVTDFNPCKYVNIPKSAAKNTREPISDKDIEKIRNSSEPMTLPAMLMCYAGLRRGELCALTWNDIDFNKRIIHINKSYNFKQQEVKTPKTEAGTRDVPIVDILYDYLLSVKKTSVLVVTDNGKPYTEGRWLKEFNKFCKTVGIDTTAHCLRHTFATLLYEADVDIFTTKEVMGHAELSTTREIYTHLRDNQREKSLKKLNEYLAK